MKQSPKKLLQSTFEYPGDEHIRRVNRFLKRCLRECGLISRSISLVDDPKDIADARPATEQIPGGAA